MLLVCSLCEDSNLDRCVRQFLWIGSFLALQLHRWNELMGCGEPTCGMDAWWDGKTPQTWQEPQLDFYKFGQLFR